ncbi:MAG: DUF4249 domain-containing protein [Bacteroidetes bacterium]|nr:DUF4249 domain-containing protein [Bacteroidota bacterium]
MKVLKYISFFLLFSGCLEPYEFESEELPDVIVVDGYFTSQNGDHFVQLRKVSSYGDGPGRAVLYANVRLLDDTGEIGFFTDMADGLYRLPATQMTGEAGRSYTLEIELLSGEIIRSAQQTLLPRIEADSAYFKFENEALKVYVDTPVPSDEDVFLRWTYDEVYLFISQPCNPFNTTTNCYIEKQPVVNRFPTNTNRGLSTNRLDGNQIVYDSNIRGKSEEYKNIHVFNIYQRRVNAATYDYWSRLDQVINQQGTIFDPIPAAVPGNMHYVDDPDKQVLGYFEVASVDTVRTFVRETDVRESISSFLPFCPPISSYADYLYFLSSGNPPPDICCSCFGIPGNIPQPDYF